MPRFSIIIVTWNALHHLQTFLPSVAATDYADFEIIIADNASTDGSKQWVKERFPAVKIVTFDKNYGYCGGNNRAVPYTSGDVLLFLNNDVKVEPDWLKALGRLFDDEPEIAAAQPKMRSYENPEQFEYAGAAGGFIDKYGFPFCRGRVFDTVEPDKGQYDEPTDIFWASGAALAIRKKIFNDFGGFDEDFEFHMEEIDLCWRLWNCGYKVRYCPDSVVYHLGGGSLPMDSPRKMYYNFRNGLLMLWKNYSTQSLLLRFPLRLVFDSFAAMRELFSGNVSGFKAIFIAHWHFWRSIGKTIKKRKKLRAKNDQKRQSDFPIILPVSVVWEYFKKGKHTFYEIFQQLK